MFSNGCLNIKPAPSCTIIKRLRGFSLIEILVSLVISMLAILAIYQTYLGTEKASRTLNSVSQAQSAGLYAMFLVQQETGNAGSGIMLNISQLDKCQKSLPIDSHTAQALSLRGAPVIIKSGENSHKDELFVMYGSNDYTTTSWQAGAQQGTGITVRAPAWAINTGDYLIEVPSTGSNCQLKTITTVGNGPTSSTLTVTPAGSNISTNARLVNLGQAVVRQKFSVSDKNVLSVSHYQVDHAGRWLRQQQKPVAGNVVLFRAQYGIDTNDDQQVDIWLNPGDTDTHGNVWTEDFVSNAAPEIILSIKAIRIALIVQSDEPDKTLKATTYTTQLFQDCPDGTACPAGTALNVSFAPLAGQPYGWRYRAYESVIPLKNFIWSRTTD